MKLRKIITLKLFCLTEVAKHFAVSVPFGQNVCHLVDNLIRSESLRQIFKDEDILCM